MINEKTVSDAIEYRRSVRVFSNQDLDSENVKKCLHNASLAPNSSNLQLWEFYHVTNKNLMTKISRACFNQPAAKTANQFVVVVTRKDLWNSRRKFNLNYIKNRSSISKNKGLKNKNIAINYYKYLIPTIYNEFFGILGFIRYINAMIIGLFRPIYRQAVSYTHLRAHET